MAGTLGLTLAVASFATPAAAQTGGADGTGLRAALSASIAEEEVVSINEHLAPSSVTQPGTDSDDVAGLDIDEEFLGLQADVIASESTWDAEGTRARAEIATADLRLDDTEVVHAETLTADAVCPTEGDTSADAQVANLRLLDQAIDADADLPVDATVPVDLGIEEVVSAEATVTLDQIERASADDAHAAALVVDVHLRAVLSDQEVAEVDVGEIALAEATCERPPEGAAEGGAPDEGQEPTSDEGDGSGDEGAPGDELGLPEDNEGDGASDGDADGPSADELEPDAGPAEGGTEVTVEGTELDATEQVTIDGTEVDFEVGDDTDTLTFVTPGGEPGPVDVEVTFDDGTSDVLEFTYEDDTEVLSGAQTAPEDEDGTAADTAGRPGAGGPDTTTAAAGDASTAGAGDALPATGSTSLTATAFGLLLLAAGAWLVSHRGRQASVR